MNNVVPDGDPQIGFTCSQPDGTPMGLSNKGDNPKKHRRKYSRNRPLLFRAGTIFLAL
jgi:hypothetical protein